MISTEYITLLGIAVQTFLFLFGGAAMVLRTDFSNKTLKEQVARIQTDLEGLAVVVTTLAVQDERLNNQARRIDTLDDKLERLRRGDGFVAGARGVEKEY
jgi:hypothetical protein